MLESIFPCHLYLQCVRYENVLDHVTFQITFDLKCENQRIDSLFSICQYRSECNYLHVICQKDCQMALFTQICPRYCLMLPLKKLNCLSCVLLICLEIRLFLFKICLFKAEVMSQRGLFYCGVWLDF